MTVYLLSYPRKQGVWKTMGKKKQKWSEKQIDKRISRLEGMSDEEFMSVFNKEMTKGVSILGVGVLLVIGCVVAMFLL